MCGRNLCRDESHDKRRVGIPVSTTLNPFPGKKLFNAFARGETHSGPYWRCDNRWEDSGWQSRLLVGEAVRRLKGCRFDLVRSDSVQATWEGVPCAARSHTCSFWMDVCEEIYQCHPRPSKKAPPRLHCTLYTQNSTPAPVYIF